MLSHAAKTRKRETKNIVWEPKKKLCDKAQTYEQRIRIREKIREDIKDAADNVDELQNMKNRKLTDRLKESNVIYKEVLHPSEAIVDLEYQKELAFIGENAFRGRAQQVDISLKDLSSGIVRKYQNLSTHEEGTDVDWKEIGILAAEFIATIPPTEFMAGLFAKEFEPQKKRPTKHKPVQQALERETTAREIVDTSKEEKTHTEGRVKTLIKLLKKKAKNWTNYFKIVTNPESFSETVENVFDLSFVIKLPYAEMKVIDGMPFVRYRDWKNVKGADGMIKHQGIFKMDSRIHQAMISGLKITESFIKTREKALAKTTKF